MDLAEANRLRWPGRGGHSEEYYLKLNLPESRRAFWIRYTVLAPVDAPAVGQVWGIAFDPEPAARQFALRATFPMPAPGGLHFGENSFESTRARGRLAAPEHTLEWDLEISSRRPPVQLFPYGWMYRAGVPRTKFVGSQMDARFSGAIHADGEALAVRDARGQQAHLWGTQPAPEWAWAHCNAWEDGADAVFEALTARTRVGPFVTPPLSMFYVRVGDDEMVFNSPAVMLAGASKWDLDGWVFGAVQGTWRVAGSVRCRREGLVVVDYTGPRGERRYCHNSMIAAVELEVARGAQVTRLRAQDACAYEWVCPRPQGGLEARVIDL